MKKKYLLLFVLFFCWNNNTGSKKKRKKKRNKINTFQISPNSKTPNLITQLRAPEIVETKIIENEILNEPVIKTLAVEKNEEKKNKNTFNTAQKYLEELTDAIYFLTPFCNGIYALFYCYFQINKDAFNYDKSDEFITKKERENLIKYEGIPVLTQNILKNETIYFIHFSKIFAITNSFYEIFKQTNKNEEINREEFIQNFTDELKKSFFEETLKSNISLLLLIFLIEITYASIINSELDLAEKTLEEKNQIISLNIKNKCIKAIIKHLKEINKNIFKNITNNSPEIEYSIEKKFNLFSIIDFLKEFLNNLDQYFIIINEEKNILTTKDISNTMKKIAKKYEIILNETNKKLTNIEKQIDSTIDTLIKKLEEINQSELAEKEKINDFFENNLIIDKQKNIIQSLKKMFNVKKKLSYEQVSIFAPEDLFIQQIEKLLELKFNQNNQYSLRSELIKKNEFLYSEFMENILYTYEPLNFSTNKNEIKNFFEKIFKENLDYKSIRDYVIQIIYLQGKKNTNQTIIDINELFLSLFKLFFKKWILNNNKVEQINTKFLVRVKSYIKSIPIGIGKNILGSIGTMIHPNKTKISEKQIKRTIFDRDIEIEETEVIRSKEEGYKALREDYLNAKTNVKKIPQIPTHVFRWFGKKKRTIFG